MTTSELLASLPYKAPFLFVDDIDNISENGVTGHYTFRDDAFFYEGHFINNPVTPGVILTECMAQIGVVCLGLFLLQKDLDVEPRPEIALTSHSIDFFIPVLPNAKVTVVSEKEVFRFNKLICRVKMLSDTNALIARGEISGMLKNRYP